LKKLTLCFIGIDGSGKTTHVMALLRRLNALGLRSEFAYMRGVGFTFFSFPFILLSKILGYEINPDGSSTAMQRHFAFRFRNTVIADLWSFLRLVDVVFLITIRRSLSKARIIVCDRYIYDAIVDLSTILQRNIHHRRDVIYLTNVVKPDVAILLFLDEQEAFRRKQEHSLSALKYRNQIYRELVKKWDIHVFKSDRPFDIVHDDVLKYVKGVLEIKLSKVKTG